MNIYDDSTNYTIIDEEMSVNYIKPEYINMNYHHSRNNLYILNEKIKFYEDENHEFKKITFISEKDFYYLKETLSKYICAYLNTNPGILYIGINDDGTIVGTKLSTIDVHKIEKTIESLIKSFDPHVNEQNLIQYVIKKIYHNNNEIIDLYIIEIFVKQGLKNFVYLTPSDECFIKLNGTLRNLKLGNDLFNYIKQKMKKYYSKKAKSVLKYTSKSKENLIINQQFKDHKI
jgi:predicted HTH transcriptional regulator